ncbi:MAG: hypothetical protein AAGH83_05455 [Pseudomonadota bacterium]
MVHRLVVPPNADSGPVGSDLLESLRRELASAVGLDLARFQLLVGGHGRFVRVSEDLAQIADLIPGPDGFCAIDDTATRPTWSAAYGHLLSCLLPETETGLRSILGKDYASWLVCRDSAPDGVGRYKLFRTWVTATLPPRRAKAALRAFEFEMASPHCYAIAMYNDLRVRPMFVEADGSLCRRPVYSCRLEAAFNCLRESTPFEIAVGRSDSGDLAPSATPVADGQTQVKSRSDGILAKFRSHPVSYRARVKRHGLLPVVRGDWYEQCELERAWNAPEDPTVWDEAADAGGWERFFGPGGVLARRFGQLLVVEDVAVSITSFAAYSDVEVAELAALGTLGIGPRGTSAAERVKILRNRDGSVTMDVNDPPGFLQVWGGGVVEAPN